MEHFYGEFLVAKWVKNDTQFNTTITVDSGDVPNILFHTPLDRSFTCGTWGSTKLRVSSKTLPEPHIPETYPNATVATSKLKFDAFRNTGHKIPTGFRVIILFSSRKRDLEITFIFFFFRFFR